MDYVMDGKLSPQQWQKMDAAREEIRQSNFKIVSGAGLGISGIKATALSHRADIVIIDYLQIIQMPGRMSRYEKITEISMGLHRFELQFGPGKNGGSCIRKQWLDCLEVSRV